MLMGTGSDAKGLKTLKAASLLMQQSILFVSMTKLIEIEIILWNDNNVFLSSYHLI